jgi:colanic acid/amylovoran biosynthesis glycosyltransferase
MTATRRPTDPPTVAYVMTHYPNPSHSFLRQEIIGVGSCGVTVVPVSVNPATDGDLLTELDHTEHARTFYVKETSSIRALLTVLTLLVRHPVRLVKFLFAAASSGGTDLSLATKRTFQSVEGLLVWRRCRRAGARHIHAHFAGTPGHVTRFAIDAARVFGGERWTWSVTVHGPHDFMNERLAGLDMITARADAVVAISDFTGAQLMRLAPPDRRDRVKVVRCGIDLDQFPLRPSTHIDTTGAASPITLLNVGRLAPEKGQWVLIDALRKVVDLGIDARLRIIGSGPLREQLEQQVTDLGLTERVDFVGVVPQQIVRAELERADMFCLPSFAEGLPISIMEALAVGVPVVCTSIAGIPELVLDGITGCCVPAGSVDSFADAIERLARDPELRANVICAGRLRVEQRHDTKDSAGRLAAVFSQLVDDNQERSRA